MRFGRKPRGNEKLEALARKIEAVAKADQQRVRQAQEYARLRSRAAMELHQTCAALTGELNALLPEPLVELSPPEYSADAFRDSGPNVFQINVSGRIVHLEFHSTETLTSTEKFATPYILEGSVRAFNQELLELSVVPEQFLFCCVERERLNWLWFDPRSQRSAPLDRTRLIQLLDRLM
ncbi:MAG: hypothetical protein ACE141_12905 [Bryobacteraceae bacterium]